MGQIVFMRRTPTEVEKFGGEVFVDIDGKNVGKVGLDDFEVVVSEGNHQIKMYKSHKYDTFIGFAEATLEIAAGDKLLVKYSPPMVVSQPGNMVITDYDELAVEQSVREREQSIKRDVNEEDARKAEQKQKSQNGMTLVVVLMIIAGVFWAIWYSSMMSAISY